MDALTAIFTRRSVRKYTEEVLTDEQKKILLKAGLYAPSAKNLQPARFIAIDDRKVLDEINNAHPYAKMILEAPFAIVVCGDTTVNPDQWHIDCSAATQNILIAAKSMGLDSVWLGVYPTKDRVESIQALLHLPKEIVPLSIAVIGYSNEVKENPDRWDDKKIKYNRWN